MPTPRRVPFASPALTLALLAVTVAGAGVGCFSSDSAAPAGGPDGSAPDGSAADDAASGADASSEAAAPTPDAAAADAPTGDATPSEAGVVLGDAGDPTVPVIVGTGAPSSLSGAASSDGSAMLILGGGGLTTEPGIISFTHYEPGSGWSTVAALPGATEPEDPPKVGMDGAGNAYVAWVSPGATTLSVNLARYDHATQTWGAVQHPDPYAQQFALLIALAVNAGGDVLLLDFHAGATGEHDAVAQHYAAGSPVGTWTQEIVTAYPNSGGPGQAGNPQVSLADTGMAVAAWTTAGAGAYAAATRSGTTWTPTPQATFSVNQLGVGVNGAGDVLIGYEDLSTIPNAYQYDAASMTWSTMPAKLTAETEGSRLLACPLTVNVSGTGDATLARCFSGSPQIIESYAYTKSTKTWGAVAPIPTTGYSFSTSFAFNGAGSGLAVFDDGATNTTSSGSAVSSTYETSTGWSPQSAGLGTTGSGTVLALLAPDGAGWAAWVENNARLKIAKVR
jgi:hypothetical protein